MDIYFILSTPGTIRIKKFRSVIRLEGFIEKNYEALKNSSIAMINAETGKQIGNIDVQEYYKRKNLQNQ